MQDGVPLAITGIVHVKATMETGEISPGDLLTSSSKPGYAMKAKNPEIGTVIGKSLESLDEEGMVKILVTLQ